MSAAAKSWIVQAVADLELAVLAFQNRLWAAACLNAQQSVAKFGKGLLIHADVLPDHTHNISKINDRIELAGLHVFTEEEREGAKTMSRTFLTSRSPNLAADTAPCEMFTKGDTRQYLDWAFNYFDIAIHVAPSLVESAVPGRRGVLRQAMDKARTLAAQAKKSDLGM